MIKESRKTNGQRTTIPKAVSDYLLFSMPYSPTFHTKPVPDYLGLSLRYTQLPYKVFLSHSLMPISDLTYYEILEKIPKGYRISTALEELIPQLEEEKAGRDPTKSKFYDDLFRHNITKPLLLRKSLLTDTFVRIPSGMRYPETPDYVDGRGRKYYAREVGIGNKVIGLYLLPEYGVIPRTTDVEDVWDLTTGLPRFTLETGDHTTYWFHQPTQRESAVVRENEGGGDFVLTACYNRLYTGYDFIRTVRSHLTLPVKEKIKK